MYSLGTFRIVGALSLSALALSLLVAAPAESARATDVISQIGDDIDGTPHDFMGESVALNGDGSRIVIGGLQFDTNNIGPGVARVFERVDGAWVQLGSTLQGGTNAELFGVSVSMNSSGTRIAVGAKETPLPPITQLGDKGVVRVYQWTGITWTQLGSDFEGAANLSEAGDSVSLNADGSVLAFGAPGYSASDELFSVGHVQIWAWDGSTWVSRGQIVGEAAGDTSGRSVSLNADGTRVAIGSPNNDSTGMRSGQVEVWEWQSGTTWTQVGADIEGQQTDDNLGLSVALDSSGNRVVTGGYTNNVGPYQHGGLVRIYDWTGTEWRQVGEDIEAQALGDELGESLSLSSDGSILAVGASRNDAGGDTAGQVSLFRLTQTSWCPIGEPINGEAPGDRFGESVAISGDGTVFAGGATRNSGGGTNAGHTRVFSISNPPGCGGKPSAPAQTSAEESGTPGIFLTVMTPDNRRASVATIKFGAYAIASGSPYSLSVRFDSIDSTARLIASGRVHVGGHLEESVAFPDLPGGAYTITFTAQDSRGGLLILGNRVNLDSLGNFLSITAENLQPTVR